MDEGSQGEPVVLIHRLGGYVETWLPSFDALVAQHRVVAVDLPGHGRTDKPTDAPYGVEDLAGFVKDFMAALQITRAHVVGHSVGGVVAIRLTLLHPAVVTKLVLVAPAGFGKEFHPMDLNASMPDIDRISPCPMQLRTRASVGLFGTRRDILTVHEASGKPTATRKRC